MRLSRVLARLIVFAPPAIGQVRTRPAIADSSPAEIMTRAGPNADAFYGLETSSGNRGRNNRSPNSTKSRTVW